MRHLAKTIFVFALTGGIGVSLLSCGDNKEKEKVAVFYGNDDIPDNTDSVVGDSYSSSDYQDESVELTEAVEIPFKEVGGVKAVPVSINGCPAEFDMLIDSGCSGTLISLAEANYLYEKGYLSNDDIIGVSQSMIANGQIVNNMEIILRSIVIDGQIYCNNVRAQVSENVQAPLLLGNEILNRAASYSIDNVNKKIIFRPQ